MSTHDDQLDAIVALTPDREDIERRDIERRNGARRKPKKPARPRQRSSWGLRLSVLVCLLAVAGLGGWSYLAHQQLQVATERYAQAAVRLQALEERLMTTDKRLMTTDKSMAQSSGVVEGRLQELDSEVRKLWDNVWQKAKRRLAEQDKAIKGLQADAHSSKAQAADLALSVSQLRLALEVVEDQVDSNSAVADDVASMSARVAAQKQQLGKAEKVLKTLQQGDAKTDQRLQETEEWVASFNGYRTQINRKLLDLQGSVNALQRP